MSVLSERLATVRKEKNIAQKVAAADLDVSQALLSHYEKGIRECSPVFLAKAAVYYDVSADYLLGLSDHEKNINTVLSEEEHPLDGEPVPQTIYRALAWLNRKSEDAFPSCSERVIRMVQYSFYKIMLEFANADRLADPSVNPKTENKELFLSIAETLELKKIRESAKKSAPLTAPCPLCVKTVLKCCEEQIRTAVNDLHAQE